MSYRYYSTQRPVTICGYPKPSEANNIVNFDEKILVPEIKRLAWGYVEYANKLSDKEADRYELVMLDKKIIKDREELVTAVSFAMEQAQSGSWGADMLKAIYTIYAFSYEEMPHDDECEELLLKCKNMLESFNKGNR